MNFLVYTMVYNESQNLPRWIQYYGSQMSFDSLLIVDHGTDDGSVSNLGDIGRLKIPRKTLNEVARCKLISHIQNTLQPHYDAIIFIDCDEFIIADPNKYSSLRHYLEAFVKSESVSVRPIGLNLVHMYGHEPPFDATRRILEQREYAWFHSIYCKPALVKERADWAIGFHNSNLASQVDPDLYLFHLRDLDYGLALSRLAITRGLPWEPPHLESGVGWHQRLSDEDYIVSRFRKPQSEMEQKGPQPFEFSEGIEHVNDRKQGEFI